MWWTPVRFAEKPGWKILFADYCCERKNTILCLISQLDKFKRTVVLASETHERHQIKHYSLISDKWWCTITNFFCYCKLILSSLERYKTYKTRAARYPCICWFAVRGKHLSFAEKYYWSSSNEQYQHKHRHKPNFSETNRVPNLVMIYQTTSCIYGTSL
jgi:hypothetical protein